MPLIGTDLGEEFDEQQVLAPGMILVLEPVIWEDGYGGYRAEDIYTVTDDGWASLSDFPYDPFTRGTRHDRPARPTGVGPRRHGGRCAPTVAAGCSRRWRHTGSTRSCSAGRPTSPSRRAPASCGRPGRARSARGVVVLAATGQVHLLSVWDEGIPPEIPHANLFGLKWNPVNLLGEIAAIPGCAHHPSGRHRLVRARASSTSSPASHRRRSWSTPPRR